MLSLEVFMLGLLITSALTSLVTEAVKKILAEYNKTYRANTLVGVVALLMSVAIGSSYIVLNGLEFTSAVVICLVAQVFMSWLCAMVGYDKVVQAISQFKTNGKDE